MHQDDVVYFYEYFLVTNIVVIKVYGQCIIGDTIFDILIFSWQSTIFPPCNAYASVVCLLMSSAGCNSN